MSATATWCSFSTSARTAPGSFRRRSWRRISTRFERTVWPQVDFVTLTQYDAAYACPHAFPPQTLEHILGQVVSGAGKKQLRIAETEKYPHVSYFFNGGVETPFPGEDLKMIPSPKVATYDLQPEMSAAEVTAAVVEALPNYDLVILNYANPDMVGHTGVLEGGDQGGGNRG